MMTTRDDDTGTAGSENTAPETSRTGGAQGKTKPVPETAGEKWDVGKYEGGAATSDAPTGTYAGTPTSASGGIPATGEGEKSGNTDTSVDGMKAAPDTTRAGGPVETSAGAHPETGTPTGQGGEEPLGRNAGPAGAGIDAETTGTDEAIESGRHIGAGTPTPAGPAEPNERPNP